MISAEPTNAERRPLDRQQVLRRHYPHIQRMARRLLRRFPRYVTLDDIVSAGCIGLLESVDRFDPARPKSFDIYAEYRIKGAIFDALRAADPLSRDQRAYAGALREARLRLEGRYYRAPDSEELASELGCDLERYYELTTRLAEARPVRLRERFLSAQAHLQGDPFLDVSSSETRVLLIQAIESLPKRQRTIITLYYFEDMTLSEIGATLGVTESRVCQLRGEAMAQLRHFMNVGQED